MGALVGGQLVELWEDSREGLGRAKRSRISCVAVVRTTRLVSSSLEISPSRSSLVRSGGDGAVTGLSGVPL